LEVVALDYHKFRDRSMGCTGAFTLVDGATDGAWAVGVNSKTKVKEVIKGHKQNMAAVGFPLKVVRMDFASEAGKEVEEACAELGLRLIKAPPEHQRQDPAELSWKRLKRIMVAIMMSQPLLGNSSWMLALSQACKFVMISGNAKCDLIKAGATPLEILYGEKPDISFQADHPVGKPAVTKKTKAHRREGQPVNDLMITGQTSVDGSKTLFLVRPGSDKLLPRGGAKMLDLPKVEISKEDLAKIKVVERDGEVVIEGLEGRQVSDVSLQGLQQLYRTRAEEEAEKERQQLLMDEAAGAMQAESSDNSKLADQLQAVAEMLQAEEGQQAVAREESAAAEEMQSEVTEEDDGDYNYWGKTAAGLQIEPDLSRSEAAQIEARMAWGEFLDRPLSLDEMRTLDRYFASYGVYPRPSGCGQDSAGVEASGAQPVDESEQLWLSRLGMREWELCLEGDPPMCMLRLREECEEAEGDEGEESGSSAGLVAGAVQKRLKAPKYGKVKKDEQLLLEWKPTVQGETFGLIDMNCLKIRKDLTRADVPVVDHIMILDYKRNMSKKGRLVLRGDRMKHWFRDPSVLYAPSAGQQEVLFFWFVCTYYDMFDRSCDVTKAFANNSFDEAAIPLEIYLELDEIESPLQKPTIVQAMCALYGLPSASMEWERHTDSFAKDMGMRAISSLKKFYYKLVGERGLIVWLVVTDDFGMASTKDKESLRELERMVQEMGARWGITEQVPIKDLIGIEPRKNPDGSRTLLQPAEIEKLREDMFDGGPVPQVTTPLPAGYRGHRSDEMPRADKKKFQRRVGRLQYLAVTRGENCAQSILAGCSSDPTVEDMEAALHYAAYLITTADMGIGLTFHKGPPDANPRDTLPVHAFTDAAVGNRRFGGGSYGLAAFLGEVDTNSAPVCTVAVAEKGAGTASSNVELGALVMAAKRVQQLRQAAEEISGKLPEGALEVPAEDRAPASEVFEDNHVLADLTQRPSSHEAKQMKTFARQLDFLRSLGRDNLLAVIKIFAASQVADPLTKVSDSASEGSRFMHRLLGQHGAVTEFQERCRKDGREKRAPTQLTASAAVMTLDFGSDEEGEMECEGSDKGNWPDWNDSEAVADRTVQNTLAAMTDCQEGEKLRRGWAEAQKADSRRDERGDSLGQGSASSVTAPSSSSASASASESVEEEMEEEREMERESLGTARRAAVGSGGEQSASLGSGKQSEFSAAGCVRAGAEESDEEEREVAEERERQQSRDAEEGASFSPPRKKWEREGKRPRGPRGNRYKRMKS
jgi:hypothetical protein